jgi:hypothetical protein
LTVIRRIETDADFANVTSSYGGTNLKYIVPPLSDDEIKAAVEAADQAGPKFDESAKSNARRAHPVEANPRKPSNLWKKLFGGKKSGKGQQTPDVPTPLDYLVFEERVKERVVVCVVMKATWIEPMIAELRESLSDASTSTEIMMVSFASKAAGLPREVEVANMELQDHSGKLVKRLEDARNIVNPPLPGEWAVPCYFAKLIKSF